MSPSPTDATGLDFVCMEIKWLCKRSSHQLWEKIRGQGYGLFACLCVWFVAIENFTDLTYWESENWWIFFQGSQSKLDRKERNGSHSLTDMLPAAIAVVLLLLLVVLICFLLLWWWILCLRLSPLQAPLPFFSHPPDEGANMKMGGCSRATGAAAAGNTWIKREREI